MEHQLIDGGFVVADRSKAKKAQEEFMRDETPPELSADGFGYVTVQSAPEELLNTFDLKKRRVVNTWGGLPVTFMQGGLNGNVHFSGVGIVRYGAAREAEIQQILASDPDRLNDLDLDQLGELHDYFQQSHAGLAAIIEALCPLSGTDSLSGTAR
jgi:hypothetical protein